MVGVRSGLLFCALFTIIRGLVLDPRLAASPTTGSTKCDKVAVAYTFLARADLPLWPVWETYFKGCPQGSFKILVHTQTRGAAEANVSSLGGTELKGSKVIQGELRYSWNMVEAMINLYGGVQGGGAAPNGCQPQWVQMLSESCAPILPCATVHSYLERNAGSSFVRQLRTIPPSESLHKSSQWTTLWWEHAQELWRDRDTIRDKWSSRGSDQRFVESADDLVVGFDSVFIDGVEYHGALDSFVFVNELKERGLRMVDNSLTYVSGLTGHDHPTEYSSVAGVTKAVNQAYSLTKHHPEKQRMFARKFSAEATATLIEFLTKRM